MTDKSILQALRCCAEGECKDCAMHEDKQRCQENLLDKAAEAIERLTAENAALREKVPLTEDTMINLAAQALGVVPSRLRELAEADKDGRVVVLPPEERTLDFPEKYTEIRALYHFCVDLGIKCTIEHLYDGYAVRFPDGSDFAQHHGTYGGTEGCVEPAIGDSEFDYTAVGLNLAKELVKKHKGKLEANHA